MNKTVKRILYIGIVIVILGAIIYPKLPNGDSSAAAGPAVRPKLTVDGLVLAGQQLKNQINITDMNVGRSVDGYGALMVISTQNPVSEMVAEHLINTEGVTQCSIINLQI